jgi:glucose-6-phosphate 1-dehydrogenase
MSERTPIRQCVIFGASGDLAARYLIPAFFELWIRGRLPPDLRILGVARENWDDATFRRHAAERTAVPHDGGEALPAEFLSMLRYDNVLELGLRPDRVGLQVNVNGVGDRLVLETIVLDRTLADQELSAYARLMLDVLNGDPRCPFETMKWKSPGAS